MAVAAAAAGVDADAGADADADTGDSAAATVVVDAAAAAAVDVVVVVFCCCCCRLPAPHKKTRGERKGSIAFRSAVVLWLIFPPITWKTRVQFQAAEEFLSRGLWV